MLLSHHLCTRSDDKWRQSSSRVNETRLREDMKYQVLLRMWDMWAFGLSIVLFALERTTR